MLTIKPSKTENKTETVSVRIPESLKQKLLEKCEENQVSISSAVEQLIEYFCSQENPPN